MKQVFLCVVRGLSAPHTADLCHLLPPAGGSGDGRGVQPGGQQQDPGSIYRRLSEAINSASLQRCLWTLVQISDTSSDKCDGCVNIATCPYWHVDRKDAEVISEPKPTAVSSEVDAENEISGSKNKSAWRYLAAFKSKKCWTRWLKGFASCYFFL